MFAGLKQKLGEGLTHTAARSLYLANQPKAVSNGLCRLVTINFTRMSFFAKFDGSVIVKLESAAFCNQQSQLWHV